MTVLSYFFQIGALTYALAWLGHKMVSCDCAIDHVSLSLTLYCLRVASCFLFW
jgi:hypothetical protein